MWVNIESRLTGRTYFDVTPQFSGCAVTELGRLLS